MNKIVNVGIVGLGNLGRGVLKDFFDNCGYIKQKLGGDFEISFKTICDAKIDKLKLDFVPAEVSRAKDFMEVVNDPEIMIVVEAIGGTREAFTLAEEVLKRGKYLVTANKDLLARKGSQLHQIAQENGVSIGIEGALLGGLPIVSVIRNGLISDRIHSFYGIVNGATNFILTKWENKEGTYDSLLKEVEKRGYLEKDPLYDLDGLDAAEKAIILGRLCFGKKIEVEDVYYQGIRRIRVEDFEFARQLGFIVRLIANGSMDEHQRLSLSVAPTLVRKDNLLALVKENHSALFIHGEKSGETFYYSKVGSATETGISIISDIINFAREICDGECCRKLNFENNCLDSAEIVPYEEMKFPFYMRFVVEDQPGVLAQIDEILAWHKINIRSVINIRNYPTLSNPKVISFVIDVDPAPVKEIEEAVSEMQGLKFFQEEPFVMRMMMQ